MPNPDLRKSAPARMYTPAAVPSTVVPGLQGTEREAENPAPSPSRWTPVSEGGPALGTTRPLHRQQQHLQSLADNRPGREQEEQLAAMANAGAREGALQGERLDRDVEVARVVEDVPTDAQEVQAVEAVDEAQALRNTTKNILEKDAPSLKLKYDQYFYDKIGGGHRGMLTRESPERKAARAKWKEAARAKATQDLALAIGNDNPAAQQGPATKRYIEMLAQTQIYGAAKASMEKGLEKAAKELTLRLFAPHISFLPPGKLSVKRASDWVKSRGIGKQAVELKNSVIGKNQDKIIDRVLEQMTVVEVEKEIDSGKVGKNALLKMTTECTTADEGMGKLGQLLDKAVTDPGDSIAVSAELKIPIHSAFIKIGVEGKAAKGIDGAMTPGVPTLGDPDHFEFMAQLSIGGGVDLIGLKAGLTANLFARAGAASTPKAMKAFSYGAYRSASGINARLATFCWSGPEKGATLEKVERAELWAAMVEESVFQGDGSAYAHVGGEGVGDVSVNIGKKVAGVDAALGLGGYKEYNEESLTESMGDQFATPAIGKAASKRRQTEAKGAAKFQFALGSSVTAKIPGTSGIVFSGSISGNDLVNWGIEISGTLTKSSGGSTLAERVTTATVGALGSLVKNLVRAWKSKHEPTAGELVARELSVVDDGLHLEDAALSGKLSSAIDNAWKNSNSGSSFKLGSDVPEKLTALDKQLESGAISEEAYKTEWGKLNEDEALESGGMSSESSIQLALLVSCEDGKFPATKRIELRQINSKGIDIDLGGAGISINYEKVKRLLAIEHTRDDGWKAEIMGQRI